MWLSLPCFLTFAVLLSLHLVTFLMVFFNILSLFSSRRMPQLRFAITQPQNSVLTRQHKWTIDSDISYTSALWDFEVVKKQWGCALLRKKWCCFVCKPLWEDHAVLSYPAWRKKKERSRKKNICRILRVPGLVPSQCFLVPLGAMLVIKTLEDEWYVVIKDYKFTVLEIFLVLACLRYPYIRVYRLYDMCAWTQIGNTSAHSPWGH